MRRSLVCGALWYVALYGGHLTGPDHYVAKLQISFFSGSGGTAVSLASGSRFVTPTLDRTRPRSLQYTHARYRRLHALLQKWRGHSARLSIEHCVWALTLHCVHRLVYSCWASWVLMSDGPWPGESQSVRVLWGSALAGPDATLPPPCVLKLNLEASNCHPKYACVYAGALGPFLPAGGSAVYNLPLRAHIRLFRGVREANRKKWRRCGCSWQWALLRPRMAR